MYAPYMAPQIRTTANLVNVLRAFLDDPAREHYGYDLMRTTGMPSGRIYPILASLEANNVIEGHQEDVAAKDVGRRPRHYYRITAGGAVYARQAVAEFYSAVGARPPKGFGLPGVSPA